MKAKFIYEALDFERGIDPKDSMELGRLGKRAMDRMKPGVIYVSSTPRWGYYWFYKDPRDNKIYKAFSLKREGGYKVDEWGNNLYNEEKDFPLDLQPTGKHFDKFLAKIVQVNRIHEALNFERGGDPKDSIRVGRKWKWDMTGEELSIHIINDIEEKSKPILDRLKKAVKDAGFRSLEEYNNYVLDYYDSHPESSPKDVVHASKEIDNIEGELEELIKEEVEKYPFKQGINHKGSVIGDLFSLMLEGGAFMTYVDLIKGHLDKEYLKESLDFERGKDPKESMDIGMEQKYGKMYELFVICHNLSTNSENFPYVSEIVRDKDGDPFFNIESVFYYTDDDDNKIPEQFVITLHPDSIECFNVITKDEENFRTEQKFLKLTTCWDEPDQGW